MNAIKMHFSDERRVRQLKGSDFEFSFGLMLQ